MSDSTDWQVYDWENDSVRDVPPDKVFDRPVVNGEYADLTGAEAYDWPQDLEVAPTPHEWQVDGRAATPAELRDWGARVRAGERRPETTLERLGYAPGDTVVVSAAGIPQARSVTLPSEATAQAAAPVAQAAAKARLTQ